MRTSQVATVSDTRLERRNYGRNPLAAMYSKSCFCHTCGLCHCVHVDVVVRGSHHNRPRHVLWCLDQSRDETVGLEHGEVNGGCERDHYGAADARLSKVDVSEGDVGETRFCIR